jgi:hypothetical protein
MRSQWKISACAEESAGPACPPDASAQTAVPPASGYSHLSFSFAASTVCHSMFDGSSAPPSFSGFTWSIT